MTADDNITVAMDATALITGATGIARYISELSARLPGEGVDLCRFALGRAAVPVPPDVRRVRLPLRVVERTWATIGRPRVDRLCTGADILHATSVVPPPTVLPVVVTVYDVAALDYPELHPERSVQQLRRQVAALGDVAQVLAISQATADALARHGVPPHRIAVTPLGRTPLPPPRGAGVGPGPYLLAVGGLHPRKRLDLLLRAFASARLDGVRLVLAGPDGPDGVRLRTLAADLDLTSRIVFAGWVDDARLAGLYDGALALCFTSVAEGFGLPVLEAMARGVPVVATAIAATVEVAGDAALLVPPDDVSALCSALEVVAGDEGLRRDLGHRGPERAEPFTWDRTARITAAAYRRARSAS